jgi:HEAT repeat protein
MDELETLLTELACGDDMRAEAAAVRLSAFPVSVLDPLLHATDVDARWWAVRSLAGFESALEIIDRLLAALEDESEEVRQCAALGLTHHPHRQAVSPLIRALGDTDTLTAKIASNALILIGVEAVPQLIEVLKTGSPAAKLEAARALAEIKDPRAIPALMEIMQADSAVAKYWAEIGLDKLGLGMVYLKPQ